MAVTIAHVRSNVAGGYYEEIVAVTGPSSYTTGGETLTAAQINQLMPQLGGNLVAADVAKAEFFISERDTSGRQLVLDKNTTTPKMMFWAAGAEGSGNLSAVTIRARVRYGNPN